MRIPLIQQGSQAALLLSVLGIGTQALAALPPRPPSSESGHPVLPLAPQQLASPGPMSSPWWENYDVRQRFLCPQRGSMVVERNDSQASIFSGGVRFTLFREGGEGPGLHYRNDELRVTINGDELTLEQLPQRLTCIRTEEV
jgi:hypothetical protein